MKRSISICLFFVVIAAGLWPNEQPKWMTLLISLRNEKQIVVASLNKIENERQELQQIYEEREREQTERQNSIEMRRQLLDEQKQISQKRENDLDAREKSLRDRLAVLERRERQLTESAGLLTSLQQNFDGYRKAAESEIEALSAWPVITAIAVPVAVLLGVLLRSLIK